MSRFCLIDREVTLPGSIPACVPWIIYGTLPECIEARRAADPSWPKLIACIGAEPRAFIKSERAEMPAIYPAYRGERVAAYAVIGRAAYWFNIDPDKPPEGWHAEPRP